MTERELAELKRLAEAATKAPWVAHRHDGKHAEGSEIEGPGGVAITSGDPYEAVANENADFIVAARTAVPALIADLEAAQEECDRLRKADQATREAIRDGFREAKRGNCWCGGGEQHTLLCKQIKQFVGCVYE